MLVLNRQRDERIVITTPQGQRIIVMVTDIRGDQVRLGVSAPADVRIDRWEIDQIKRRGDTSARSGS